MKLEEWNQDTPKLSKEELLQLFEDEYIDGGYLYSGCIPANATLFTKHREHYELALSLVKEGKLQIRKCEGYAFELPKEKRRELITKFNLRERWSEFYYCHPEWEIQDVMGGEKRWSIENQE